MMLLLLVLPLLSLARQDRPSGHQALAYGRPRPQGRPQGQGAALDIGSLLDGVQLNVLDAKFIALGFVREDLVRLVQYTVHSAHCTLHNTQCTQHNGHCLGWGAVHEGGSRSDPGGGGKGQRRAGERRGADHHPGRQV